jgi:hypothetical protein
MIFSIGISTVEPVSALPAAYPFANGEEQTHRKENSYQDKESKSNSTHGNLLSFTCSQCMRNP